MRSVAVVALLVSMVAAGCGGGPSSTTTRGENPDRGPPSRADFIEVGDAICTNHQSRREDLESQARDLGRITTAKRAHRIAALLQQESANRVAEARELEALPSPAADPAAPVLSSIRAQARLIDEWAHAYDDLDSVAIDRLQIRLRAVSAKGAQAARTIGFEVCGRP